MNHANLLRAAALAAAMLGAGSVLAQDAPRAPTGPSSAAPGSTPIVSDVAPLPPEERGSNGALVIAPVRAQRENPTATMGAGPAPKSVARRGHRRSAVDNDLEQTGMDRQLPRHGGAIVN